MKKRKVWRSVRSLLSNRKRWGKGDFHSHGRYCLDGACMRVYGSSPSYIAAVKKIGKAVDALYPNNFGYIDFNDRDNTTHKDIMRVLNKAKV